MINVVHGVVHLGRLCSLNEYQSRAGAINSWTKLFLFVPFFLLAPFLILQVRYSCRCVHLHGVTVTRSLGRACFLFWGVHWLARVRVVRSSSREERVSWWDTVGESKMQI